MSQTTSLANNLLIAMPSLADGNFAQSVTLICEHSDKGALGIVLNKPLDMKLGDVLAQMKLDTMQAATAAQPVLRGGPVHTDRGFVLHRPGGEWDSTHKISEFIQVTTSRDVLAAIARGAGPRDAFVALGYAGWEPGQLEREILDNSWLSVPMNEQLVFEVPFEQRWQAAWQLLGVHSSRVSLVAGHALNGATALGFDFGLRRIGVAVGDSLTKSAAPLATVKHGEQGPDWPAIDRLLADYKPVNLVVGYPYNENGSAGSLAGAASRFANALARRSGLTVTRVDERYSSQEASAELKQRRAGGIRRRRVQRGDVDSLAAAIILERWLRGES